MLVSKILFEKIPNSKIRKKFALRRSRKIRWFGFGPFVEFDVFGLGPDYNPTSDKIPELLFTYYTPKNRKSRLNRKFDLCRSMHICLIWSFKQWPGLGQTPRTSLPSPGAMNPSLYSSPSTWGMAGYPPAAYAAAAAGAGAFGHFAHQPW